MQGLIVHQSSGLELHPQAWVLKGISVDRSMLLGWKSSSEGPEHADLHPLDNERGGRATEGCKQGENIILHLAQETKGRGFPISPRQQVESGLHWSPVDL